MEFRRGDPQTKSLLSKVKLETEDTKMNRSTSVSTISEQQIDNKLSGCNLANCHLLGDVCHSKNYDTFDEDQPNAQYGIDTECLTTDPACDDEHLSYAHANDAQLNKIDQNVAANECLHPFLTADAQKWQHAMTNPWRAQPVGDHRTFREKHQLPAICSRKNQCLTTREKYKTQRASMTGSAPASINSLLSVSKLLDVGEETHYLSTTQSDSNLHAPRRQEILHSQALKYFEFESESDIQFHEFVVSKASDAISAMDNSDGYADSSRVVSHLNLSLASKFQELKCKMKSHGEKHIPVQRSSNKPTTEGLTTASSPSTVHPKVLTHIKQVRETKAYDFSRSRSSAKFKTKGVSKKRVILVAGSTAGTKQLLSPNVSRAACSKKSATTVAHQLRSKNRNGVSLSDLKAEHKEALQLLQELGGPMDSDYLLIHEDCAHPALERRVGRDLMGLGW